MKRRKVVSLLGGAALWPAASRAQPAQPVIGFLHSGAADANAKRLAAFRKGLAEMGFVEGQTVAIEYRWADGRNDRLPALAAELVARKVTVIATPGSTPAAIAAKQASTTIPQVFAIGSEPIGLGLVASLSRPGGNVTGVASLNVDLAAKRLGFIRELVPQAAAYFTLSNPTSQLTEPFLKDLELGAKALGIQIEVLKATTDAELEAAFTRLPSRPGTVLLIPSDAYFYSRRPLLAARAIEHRLATAFDNRDYVDDGGLMSYGADFTDLIRIAGTYTGRILKGEKPANLPVAQTTKFELVINLKTAKALGITVPDRMLSIADDLVE